MVRIMVKSSLVARDLKKVEQIMHVILKTVQFLCVRLWCVIHNTEYFLKSMGIYSTKSVVFNFVILFFKKIGCLLKCRLWQRIQQLKCAAISQMKTVNKKLQIQRTGNKWSLWNAKEKKTVHKLSVFGKIVFMGIQVNTYNSIVHI